MFCGYSFCGYDSISTTPIYIQPIRKVSVMNAIFDAMHVSDLTVVDAHETLPTEWDADTIMHADFRGDAAAGNVDYSVYQSSALRIKRRPVGKNEWITLREVPLTTTADFSFVVFDLLAKSDTTYEYAIVPVINSIEGAIVSKPIESKFDGVFIVDRDHAYQALLDVSLEHSRVRNTTTVTTLGSKYPFSINNSKSNYSEGSVRAFFLPIDTGVCGFTTAGAITFRETLDDFLTNNEAKIIKDSYGRMWLVDIAGGVAETEEGHPEHKLTSFNWIEIGDCESQSDLYSCGFVDVAGG